METLSEKIVYSIPDKSSKIIPVDFSEDVRLMDVEAFSEYHPMFKVYTSVIEMIFPLSSMIYALPLLKTHRKTIRTLEKTYNVGSPSSPVLDSFFNMWEFFDAEIDQSEETLGDVVIKLGKKFKIDQDTLHLLSLLKDSINSVYVVQDVQEEKTLLKSIATGNTYNTYIIKEIPLEKGRRYLLRLLPAGEGEFLSLTMPYSLKASENEWKAFFEKQPLKTKNSFDLKKYCHFMKRGKSLNYWFEYLKTSATDPYSIPITLEGMPP